MNHTVLWCLFLGQTQLSPSTKNHSPLPHLNANGKKTNWPKNISRLGTYQSIVIVLVQIFGGPIKIGPFDSVTLPLVQLISFLATNISAKGAAPTQNSVMLRTHSDCSEFWPAPLPLLKTRSTYLMKKNILLLQECMPEGDGHKSSHKMRMRSTEWRMLRWWLVKSRII